MEFQPKLGILVSNSSNLHKGTINTIVTTIREVGYKHSFLTPSHATQGIAYFALI